MMAQPLVHEANSIWTPYPNIILGFSDEQDRAIAPRPSYEQISIPRSLWAKNLPIIPGANTSEPLYKLSPSSRANLEHKTSQSTQIKRNRTR